MKSAVNFHFVASWKNCLVVWLWCRCVVPRGRLVSSSVFCVRGEIARRIFTGSPRLRSSQASPASVCAASRCSQPHGRIGFGCLLEEICEAARTILKIVFPILKIVFCKKRGLALAWCPRPSGGSEVSKLFFL